MLGSEKWYTDVPLTELMDAGVVQGRTANEANGRNRTGVHGFAVSRKTKPRRPSVINQEVSRFVDTYLCQLRHTGSAQSGSKMVAGPTVPNSAFCASP